MYFYNTFSPTHISTTLKNVTRTTLPNGPQLWQSNYQNRREKNLNRSNLIAKNRRDKILVVAHIKLLLLNLGLSTSRAGSVLDPTQT